MSTSPTPPKSSTTGSLWLDVLLPHERKKAEARLAKMPPEAREAHVARMNALTQRGLAINPNPKPLEDGVVSETPF